MVQVTKAAILMSEHSHHDEHPAFEDIILFETSLCQYHICQLKALSWSGRLVVIDRT